MKIAILSDTHTGIRNSSEIFIENQRKFFSDLFFPYCIKNNITKILHLGDFYDNRKFINFKALHANRKHFLEPLRQYGMHMDIICGNHDVYYKNTNDLNSLKELLGHYMNEVSIIMEPTKLQYGDCTIGAIPWITADNEKKSLDFIKTVDCDILAGHFEIFGCEMLRGITCDHGMKSDMLDRFDKVISGHFHTKSTNGNINYLGTQLEFFWGDAHDKKYFHILDTDTKELEAIHNPHTLFEKIIYDDSKTDYNKYKLKNIDKKFVKVVVINKSDLFMFDRFIDRIQNKDIHELKIAENFNEFLGDSVSDEGISVEDTTVLLSSYIDAVDTDLDKDHIKAQMNELMIEAQTLEIS